MVVTAPIDELGLDGDNSNVHILGHNVVTVHQTGSHVLVMTGVELDHHRHRLEGSVGDLSHGELLVVRLLNRDDRDVRGEDEVDAG